MLEVKRSRGDRLHFSDGIGFDLQYKYIKVRTIESNLLVRPSLVNDHHLSKTLKFSHSKPYSKRALLVSDRDPF